MSRQTSNNVQYHEYIWYYLFKTKSKEYISSILNIILYSKFNDDLNLNVFTIVSVDNIDFGQPNECVRLDGSRGIHATSYQIIQLKLNTIKLQNVC